MPDVAATEATVLDQRGLLGDEPGPRLHTRPVAVAPKLQPEPERPGRWISNDHVGVGHDDVDGGVVGSVLLSETERVREHAAAKLTAKNVDLMVANDVSASDAGFEVDTNRAVLLDAAGGAQETPLLTKDALAGLVLDRVAALLFS